MRIIDTHMHFSNLSEYKAMALQVNQIASLKDALQNMLENNIIFGIGIGIGDLKKHSDFALHT